MSAADAHDLDSSEWVVWGLEVRDPLGFAPQGAVEGTRGPVSGLASSLGCALAGCREDNDSDDGLAPQAAFCSWLVQVPRAGHRRRDERGVPAAVARIHQELRSLLP